MRNKTLLAAALGVGMAVSMAVLPATASAAHKAPEKSTTVSTYVGSAQEEANNKAFFDAVMKSALAKQAANPGVKAVTVTYDPSGAPSFAGEISSSASIWNSHVSNVHLVAGSNYDFYYTEGNDPQGSYASTDGHGSGYVFLDYAQAGQYDPLRITAHETGHVLGLPDHYEGPCSELMSGGGPGPSCTNSNPNASESAQVNSLWANGVSAFDKHGFTKAH